LLGSCSFLIPAGRTNGRRVLRTPLHAHGDGWFARRRAVRISAPVAACRVACPVASAAGHAWEVLIPRGRRFQTCRAMSQICFRNQACTLSPRVPCRLCRGAERRALEQCRTPRPLMRPANRPGPPVAVSAERGGSDGAGSDVTCQILHGACVRERGGGREGMLRGFPSPLVSKGVRRVRRLRRVVH
jgi:hypothetical protein